MKKIQLLVLTGVIMLSSCTMEKRHFLPGYYTDFKNSGSKAQFDKSANQSITKQNIVVTNAPVKAAPSIEISVQKSFLAKNENSKAVAPNSRGENRKSKAALVGATKTFAKADQINSERTEKKKSRPKSQSPANSDFPGWAYVLIALLLPPLAVALKYGVHLAFWLCLLFTLLGFVPGLIYALVYLAIEGNSPEK